MKDTAGKVPEVIVFPPDAGHPHPDLMKLNTSFHSQGKFTVTFKVVPAESNEAPQHVVFTVAGMVWVEEDLVLRLTLKPVKPQGKEFVGGDLCEAVYDLRNLASP